MPNHVTNIVELRGSPTQIQEMMEHIQDEKVGTGSIDFNKIIPMPPSLNIQAGSMTDRGLKAYRDFISVYTLEGTRPGLDLLDIPQEREEAFLKMRPDIKPGEWELGRTAFQNQQRFGSSTWYDWSIKNWGTKWNAYDCIPGKDALTFSTAWSAPHPILEKLSQMYPEVILEHRWADEDIGMNCGQRTYQGGQIIDEYYPDYGRRSKEFAADVLGEDLADRGLVLNEEGTDYEYHEEIEEEMVMR